MPVDIVMKSKQYQKSRDRLTLHQIAHPVDRALLDILEKAHVGELLREPVEQMVALEYGEVLATGIPLTRDSYPEVHRILTDATKLLGIQLPHTVVNSAAVNGFNAFATGTDAHPHIVVSGSVVRVFSEPELRFILGHECGHIAMEHMVYHTAGSLAGVLGSYLPLVGPVLAKTVTLPLNAWNRCSEVTADRVGLLCCGDLLTAQTALLRLVGGFADISTVDMQTYIQQSRAMYNAQPLGKLREFLSSHPVIFKRMQALSYFASSELYFQALKQPFPTGQLLLTAAQLQKKTDQLLRIL